MNADPIARCYRWLEYFGFGRALERRRFAFLPRIGQARRILVLGEGDGRFLARLVLQNPHASIDYVDLSEKMLALARARAGSERITYTRADALALHLPDAEFDLIVTHFFLDCLNLEQARTLIAKLTRAAQPNALWLISEFRDRSKWARAVVRSLYFFFRITTGLETRALVDHHALLAQNRWRLEREQTGHAGLLASELWSRERQ